jgi:hypothetical protein
MVRLPRAVTGAICATLVTAITWPLDRHKILRQYGVSDTSHDGWRDGWRVSTCGAACGSLVYFGAYESLLAASQPVPLAAATAAALSATILAPTSTLKRRAQLRRHVPRLRPLRPGALRDAYLLTLLREVPCTTVKHVVYEGALALLLPVVRHGATRGALAAALACTCVTVLFYPLEWARTQLAMCSSLRAVWEKLRREPLVSYGGVRASLAHALCTNVAGYALLEHLSPRITPRS